MTYLEKAKKWQNYDNLESSLKDELSKMSDSELQEAFTNDLEFGTGGLRGVLGVGTNRMNIYIVRKATLGFGRYLSRFDKAYDRGVVIAHDNRHMSKEFALDSAKVLSSMGYNVYLFTDLRPTPELSFAVRYLNCIGGIMITASHNPKEYNGYKIYDSDGCQLVPEYADQVIEEINKIDDYFNIETGLNHDKITYLTEKIDEEYIKRVKEIILQPNLPKDFKITYTPLHGTGQVFACDVLKSVGYDVYPVTEQMTNDPDFSNTESSNPEEAKAFNRSIELAQKIGAKLALATDPDADRLGVGVLHNGKYVLLTGNQSASIILNYILETKKRLGTLPQDGYVFSTNVSSNLPIKIAHHYGLKTNITLTGFKYIGQQAKLIENKASYVFGMEESYGCLISDFVRDKDSIQAILMLCEAASYYFTKGLDLVEQLECIYKEYGYYKEEQTSISLKGLEGAKKIKEMMEYFRNNEIKLPSFKIISKEDNLKQEKITANTVEKITLPKSNVIKFNLDDDCWFVLRPSGTEPKIKVYYGVVATSNEEAQNKMLLLKNEVLEIVNNI